MTPFIPLIGAYPVTDDFEFAKDVNVAGRIKPLGIGDLKVVKQTLLAYEPGEVAYIENVLKGESKERVHRKLDRTETTLFTSEEETRDTERDTQSTDRFELKRETEQTIKEDMSVKGGTHVTASYGPDRCNGHAATSPTRPSKQDSQKSSSNFAHDVVDRSISKVQTKTKTERTTKTLNEVEETNTHGVDNTDASARARVGIYRWVDKRYRAQVYNYGVAAAPRVHRPGTGRLLSRRPQLAGVEVNATPPPPFLNDLSQVRWAARRPTTSREANYDIVRRPLRTGGITPAATCICLSLGAP